MAKTVSIFPGLAESLKSTRIPELRVPLFLSKSKGTSSLSSVLGERDLETS